MPSTEISLTETPQFRRLARFFWDVEAACKGRAYEAIDGLVAECKQDLLDLTIGDLEDHQ